MLIRMYCTQLSEYSTSTVQVQLLRLTRNGRSKGRYGLFAMAPCPWECSKFFSYSKIQLIQVLPISARPPTTRYSGNFQGFLLGFF
jgi:hypothetical protein